MVIGGSNNYDDRVDKDTINDVTCKGSAGDDDLTMTMTIFKSLKWR